MTDLQKRAAVATPVPDPCPWCGGHLAFVAVVVSEEYHPGYHNAALPLPRRERDVLAVSCSACEFIREVRA